MRRGHEVGRWEVHPWWRKIFWSRLRNTSNSVQQQQLPLHLYGDDGAEVLTFLSAAREVWTFLVCSAFFAVQHLSQKAVVNNAMDGCVEVLNAYYVCTFTLRRGLYRGRMVCCYALCSSCRWTSFFLTVVVCVFGFRTVVKRHDLTTSWQRSLKRRGVGDESQCETNQMLYLITSIFCTFPCPLSQTWHGCASLLNIFFVWFN